MNITGTRTGDAMNVNFGVENAHVRDTTATSGLINLLMGPMAWVSPKAIIWVTVEGSIPYNTKATNGTSLWVILRSILSLRVRYVGVSPKLGLSTGLQYRSNGGANHADVYYCINLQVDTGINIGMYNGVIRC